MKVSQGVESNGYRLKTSQRGRSEPKSYPLKRWAKAVFLLLAAACLALGCLLYVNWIALPWQRSLGIWTGAAGLILMGIYLCLSVLRYGVLVERDSVTVKGVFRSSTIQRSEIRGRRTYSNRSGEYAVLEAKVPDGKTLTVSNYFDLDEAWSEWIGSVPDLDAEDLESLLQEIAESEKTGGKGAVPANKLKRARSIAIFLSILSFALGLPLWIYGSSLDLNVFRAVDLLLVMLPWVVIAMEARWPALYTLMAARNDPRPSLMVVLFGSGVGLMASPFANFHLDSDTSLLLVACIPALALAAALFRASTRSPKPAVVFVGLFILSYFYGYGACSQINTQMDASTPRQYAAVVAGKAVHNGRNATSYLFLKPWKPGQAAENASVSRALYDEVKVGDAVCISAHQGALHAPWHTVESCEPTARRPAK